MLRSKVTDRTVLPKVIHICSVHFTEDFFDESQEDIETEFEGSRWNLRYSKPGLGTQPRYEALSEIMAEIDKTL